MRRTAPARPSRQRLMTRHAHPARRLIGQALEGVGHQALHRRHRHLARAQLRMHLLEHSVEVPRPRLVAIPPPPVRLRCVPRALLGCGLRRPPRLPGGLPRSATVVVGVAVVTSTTAATNGAEAVGPAGDFSAGRFEAAALGPSKARVRSERERREGKREGRSEKRANRDRAADADARAGRRAEERRGRSGCE